MNTSDETRLGKKQEKEREINKVMKNSNQDDKSRWKHCIIIISNMKK